jgi:CBS domain-containing protein
MTISINDTYKQVKEKISILGVKSFLVTNAPRTEEDECLSPVFKNKKPKKTLVGILTNRDIINFQFDDQKVSEFMTPVDHIIAL